MLNNNDLVQASPFDPYEGWTEDKKARFMAAQIAHLASLDDNGAPKRLLLPWEWEGITGE